MDLTVLAEWLSRLGITAAFGAASAWAAVRVFGKSWLQSRFDKALAEFKAEKEAWLDTLRHDQAREMEAHKYRFQRMMDRTSKLHQHEFEVLPGVWDRLTKAMSMTHTVTARVQEFPSMIGMGQGELDDFLAKQDLAEWEIGKLRELGGFERDSQLQSMIKFKRYSRAMDALKEFNNYVVSHGIFLREELRAPLDALNDLAYNALREQAIDFGGDMPPQNRYVARERFNNEWSGSLQCIRALVEARLWETSSPEKKVA